MFRLGLLLSILVLASAGCVSNHYEVELTPDGKTLKREITAWRGGGDKPENTQEFPKEELENIAKAYGADVPQQRNQKHKFSGEFAGEMPQDVGGNGSYTRWETSLGSLSIFVERFRGNDDLTADMETRLKACDQLVNLLAGWLELELKDEPGFSDLKKFLEGDLRRDVKNLSLLTWMFTSLGTGQADVDLEKTLGTELVVRASQYLVERGYFTLDQLPSFVMAVEQEDANQLLEFLKRFLAERMGIPKGQPLPKGLAFLNDPKAFETSVKTYLEKSQEFQKLMAAHNGAAADANAKPPKPGEVLTGTLLNAFPVLRIADDVLSVKLNVPLEPTATNGQWDAEGKHVRWSRSLLAPDSESTEFPAMCYAIWAEPIADVQTARFGKVALEGEDLATFCLWHQALTEAEAKEWEAFLSSLKPGKDLIPRLEAFRFSHEPAPNAGENRKGHSAKARRLLLEALGAEIK